MTRKEWYNHCIEKGTSGDLVFDILREWLEQETHYEKKIAEIQKKLEDINKRLEIKFKGWSDERTKDSGISEGTE